MTSKRLVRGLLLGSVALLGMAGALVVAYIAIEHHKIERRLVHLLCETDHQALLEACREVSRRATAGEFEVGRAYAIRRHPGRYGFPQAILNVDPLFVLIDGDGVVWVEMFWAPSHGVVAYPEGYQRSGRPGKTELVPGLRFYDEDYDSRYPKHVEYIEGLLDRGRRDAENSGDSI